MTKSGTSIGWFGFFKEEISINDSILIQIRRFRNYSPSIAPHPARMLAPYDGCLD